MRLTLLLAAGLLAAPTVFAADVDRENVTVGTEGADRIEVSFDFMAADLRIDPGDIAAAAEMEIMYDVKRVDYVVDYDVRNGTGYLVAESERLDDDDIHDDGAENEWSVVLSRNYPVSIDMEMGACDATLNLGGLQLQDLSLEVGAVSADIDFDEPNPVRCDRIDIKAGAASLDMTGIGNANFDLFRFEGGAGSFDLDFRGEYHGVSTIEIEVGMGSADIILPEGVACCVETDGDGLLSSIDFHGGGLIEVFDDIYETENYDDAETRILLQIDVGLGAIDVYWK